MLQQRQSLHGKSDRGAEAPVISLQDEKNLKENQFLSWPAPLSSLPLLCLGLLLLADSSTITGRNDSGFFGLIKHREQYAFCQHLACIFFSPCNGFLFYLPILRLLCPSPCYGSRVLSLHMCVTSFSNSTVFLSSPNCRDYYFPIRAEHQDTENGLAFQDSINSPSDCSVSHDLYTSF